MLRALGRPRLAGCDDQARGDAGVRSHPLRHPRARPVARGVVDDHQFEVLEGGAGNRVERPADLRFVVENRDQHRDPRRRARHRRAREFDPRVVRAAAELDREPLELSRQLDLAQPDPLQPLPSGRRVGIGGDRGRAGGCRNGGRGERHRPSRAALGDQAPAASISVSATPRSGTIAAASAAAACSSRRRCGSPSSSSAAAIGSSPPWT